MGSGKARTSRKEASNSGKDSVPLSTYMTPLNHNYRVCIPDYYIVDYRDTVTINAIIKSKNAQDH